MPHLPELWNMGDLSQWTGSQVVDGKDTLGISAFLSKNSLFPCMFITIACGAISGFHATQSPLMARCLKSERLARPVFYGAMITEGAVALIWATVSSYFFYYGGWKEVVNPEVVNDFMAQVQLADGQTLIQYFTAPEVVNLVCSGWLGVVGGTLAVLGVVAAPITSGDTAFRSARLIIAEALHFEQKSMVRRLTISIPLFVASLLLLIWQMKNPNPDSYYLGLDPYLRLTGMAYQVTPLVTDSEHGDFGVSTDVMYDNVMNKFLWGGLDKATPGSIYLDETVSRMVTSTRTVLLDLASNLCNEGTLARDGKYPIPANMTTDQYVADRYKKARTILDLMRARQLVCFLN